MIVDPNDFVINTDLGGLGSPDDASGSFNFPAKTLSGGAIYEHPPQSFDVDPDDFLTSVQIKLGFESRWRSVAGFGGLAYDSNLAPANPNLSYPGGFFILYYLIFYDINPLTGNRRVNIRLSITSRTTSSPTINTPAFSVDVRIITYQAPF